jgi:hypothetical protein
LGILKYHPELWGLRTLAVTHYLSKKSTTAISPFSIPALDFAPNLNWEHLAIEYPKIPREEVLGLNDPALWAIALLTKGVVDGKLIKKMIAELDNDEYHDLLPDAFAWATWRRPESDKTYHTMLRREFIRMKNIFKDTPAYHWYVDEAVAESTELLEEKLRVAEKRVQEQAKAAAKREQEQARAAAKREQEQAKFFVGALRQMIVDLVSNRYPSLTKIAMKQIKTLQQPEELRAVFNQLEKATDAEAVTELLFSLDD